MKVKFIFDTENENDIEDLAVFQLAKKMRYILIGFSCDRRHKHAEHSEEWEAGFDEAYKIFYEYCEQIGLNVGDL